MSLSRCTSASRRLSAASVHSGDATPKSHPYLPRIRTPKPFPALRSSRAIPLYRAVRVYSAQDPHSNLPRSRSPDHQPQLLQSAMQFSHQLAAIHKQAVSTVSKQAFAAFPKRSFSTSFAALLATGDKVPSASLFEGSPGNDVNLAAETQSGKSIVIGVPGAFSPACSASHVPGYLSNLKKFQDAGVSQIFVVGVNDAFVMKAWGESIDKNHSLKFLADPKGEFTKEWGVLFDASKFFGNERSKRYAALVEDGKVTAAFVEPDNVSVEVSAAENVLKNA